MFGIIVCGLSMLVPYECAWVAGWDETNGRFTFNEDDTFAEVFTKEQAERFCNRYPNYHPKIVKALAK